MPLEIRGAHFLIRSAQLVWGNTLRIGPVVCGVYIRCRGGSVAEWLACWTQAQNGPGSNRSRDAVG